MHYDLGHTPFSKMKKMARKGIIPSQIAKCNVPTCSACEYAKATRRPWRNRTSKNFGKKVCTKPGEVVSVDQLVSPTPGLIGQMVGFLTRQRYRYATVFVDHYSGLSYIYLQRTASAAETIEAKEAFERYSRTRGVTIQHYHADNGIFKAKEWVDSLTKNGQGLTYAAVRAHFQNGRAEKRIRDLQETARSMLLHAARRWPNAISAHLWPYAVRMANQSINQAPSLINAEGKSPQQLFEGTNVEMNPKYCKPFGCPVFVLDEKLQDGEPYNKWRSRARIGIYLGQSPVHNNSVALVLDRNTGRVSPQCHVRFDKNFHTAQQVRLTTEWKVATSFEREPSNADTPPDTRKRAPNESVRNLERSMKKQKQGAPNISRDTPKGEGSADPEGAGQSVPVHNDKSIHAQPGDGVQHPPEGADYSDHDHSRQDRSIPEHLSKPTRSGRVPKPNRNYNDVANSVLVNETAGNGDDIPGQMLSLQAMFPRDDGMLDDEGPLAFKASTDPDTMYYHQAMKEPDKNDFLKAMEKGSERPN